MASSDAWYVRLPDGRVLRASSTRAVRHHIERGRIPPDSRVRRSAEEEWAGLEWTREFVELVQRVRAAAGPDSTDIHEPVAAPPYRPEPSNLASRLDPMQLQTVGVRGYFEDLLAALDSTLVRNKLRIAVLAGFLTSLIVVFLSQAEDVTHELEVAYGPVIAWVVVGAFGLAAVVLAAVCVCLVTQMTYVELCRLRPARWAEARTRLGPNALNLTLSSVILVGLLLGAILSVRELPGWLLTGSTWPAEWSARVSVASGAAALGVILEVILWLLLILGLLLPPVVVVEECNFLVALVHWGRLLRRHLSRALLYEALALIPPVVMTAALLLPVEVAAAAQNDKLTAYAAEHGGEAQLKPATVQQVKMNAILPVQRIVQGLIVSPALAFLVVANVFIYLNLRYEHEPRRTTRQPAGPS
jgi:hypothetical protein